MFFFGWCVVGWTCVAVMQINQVILVDMVRVIYYVWLSPVRFTFEGGTQFPGRGASITANVSVIRSPPRSQSITDRIPYRTTSYAAVKTPELSQTSLTFCFTSTVSVSDWSDRNRTREPTITSRPDGVDDGHLRRSACGFLTSDGAGMEEGYEVEKGEG